MIIKQCHLIDKWKVSNLITVEKCRFCFVIVWKLWMCHIYCYLYLHRYLEDQRIMVIVTLTKKCNIFIILGNQKQKQSNYIYNLDLFQFIHSLNLIPITLIFVTIYNLAKKWSSFQGGWISLASLFLKAEESVQEKEKEKV